MLLIVEKILVKVRKKTLFFSCFIFGFGIAMGKIIIEIIR